MIIFVDFAVFKTVSMTDKPWQRARKTLPQKTKSSSKVSLTVPPRSPECVESKTRNNEKMDIGKSNTVIYNDPHV